MARVKECTKCRYTKTIDNFMRLAQQRLSTWCIACSFSRETAANLGLDSRNYITAGRYKQGTNPYPNGPNGKQKED